jgi:hypothetical protein
MGYEIATKKLELDDGDYAIFYVETRHGTQKEVNRLTRPFLMFPKGQAPTVTVKGDNGKPTVKGADEIGVDMAAIPHDDVNDAIIIGQVKEWSFGEVDQKTLDELPEKIRTRLVQECNELFGEQVPLAKGGDGK